jgi:RNA polymerase sigma-70 factor, ECF subfamily
VSINHVTDDELVARARQGDAAAFGELVSRHQGAVYRAARAARVPPADAEDVAQEAFLLAYRKLKSFRGEATFKTWLLTIVWNQAMNRRRASARWWRIVDDPRSGRESGASEPEWERVASPSGTPEQIAAGHELRRDIAKHIAALPPKLRDALLLSQSGEYSYEEIAAMLESPIGTVKWRVFEARRQVKKQLEASGYRVTEDVTRS